jgi:hypothetical protein
LNNVPVPAHVLTMANVLAQPEGDFVDNASLVYQLEPISIIVFTTTYAISYVHYDDHTACYNEVIQFRTT